ncbi:MAG: hypothetical protein WD749_10250 [Phycisphaerales bacterium]
MTAPDPAKKLQALVKKLRSQYGEPVPEGDCEGCPEDGCRLLWRLVYAFLAWEASASKAGAATKRLHHAVIDYNEMRVCLNDELAAMIGERYPRAHERAARLRSTLNDLYRREHSVKLERAQTLGKREAREYMDSLDGMPPFVSARLSLVALGGHAFPLDERIHQALLEEEAVPAGLPLPDAAGWLERHFRAGEALPAYLLIEKWMEDRPAQRKPATARAGGAKGRPAPEKTRGAARPGRAGKP